MTAYTLDTNILIRFSQHLPRDIFPGIWEALEALVEDGRACICEMVLQELERGGDGLHAWAKALDGFTCPTDQHEIPIVQQIASAHPEWIRGTENEGDPWVIAHAAVEDRTIVSDERRAGPGVSDRKQKIPNVADEHNVPTVKFFDFARAEGWQF